MNASCSYHDLFVCLFFSQLVPIFLKAFFTFHFVGYFHQILENWPTNLLLQPFYFNVKLFIIKNAIGNKLFRVCECI